MRVTRLATGNGSGGAILVVYALNFYTAALELAIVPLLPVFSDEFDLTTVQTGALLAAGSVAVMLASVPLGHLSDKIGARRMTAAAASLYAIAAVGQGLASTYALLLISWAVFGIGVAIVVTASLAWLSDLLPAVSRSTALGGASTVSGLGVIVGPILGGVASDAVGRKAVFLAAAVVAITLAIAALLSTSSVSHQSSARSLASTLAAARHEPLVLGGLALVGLLGLIFGLINVLIPLQLDANGLSPGDVGLVFAVSGGIFVLVSAFVMRQGAKLATLRVAGLAMLAQAALLLLPIVSLTTVALILFLVLRAPLWATSATISYPLTSEGAHRAGLGRGAIFGLANVVWGIAAFVSPLGGSLIAQLIGPPFAYGVLAIVCAAAALLLFSLEKRNRRDQPIRAI